MLRFDVLSLIGRAGGSVDLSLARLVRGPTADRLTLESVALVERHGERDADKLIRRVSLAGVAEELTFQRVQVFPHFLGEVQAQRVRSFCHTAMIANLQGGWDVKLDSALTVYRYTATIDHLEVPMAKRQQAKPQNDHWPSREAELNARPWKTTLRLTRLHWDRLEDVGDSVRRIGARYRPGPSIIVCGVLDAALPALLVADMTGLTVDPGLDEVQARTFVREWIADWLHARLAIGE